jgi:Thioredoxin
MAGKAIVLKVDTEKYPQIAARHNVRGIPNFIVFSGGQSSHAASRLGWLRPNRAVAEFCLDIRQIKTECSGPLYEKRRWRNKVGMENLSGNG